MLIVEHAVTSLRKIADKARTGEQPFFLAVGLQRPHLPSVFPEEFLELYATEDIRLPPDPFTPMNIPPIAWSNYSELQAYNDITNLHASGAINTTFPDRVVLELRRAYHSALSFSDAMIGRVLMELAEQGLGAQYDHLVLGQPRLAAW